MRSWLKLCLVAVVSVCSFVTMAATPVPERPNGPMFMKFREGVNYKVLDFVNRNQPPVSQLIDKSNGKVQVVEFFNYGCHWCHMLDPFLLRWLKTKPADVVFERVPVVFNPAWEIFAKAYYTEELLGANNKIHTPLFDAIHVDNKAFNNDSDMRAFFVAHGVDGDKFDTMFNSFSVSREVQQALALTRAYQIMGVPTVIINGKKNIYLTDTQMAGDGRNLFEIVNYILQQEGIKLQPAAPVAQPAPPGIAAQPKVIKQ